MTETEITAKLEAELGFRIDEKMNVIYANGTFRKADGEEWRMWQMLLVDFHARLRLERLLDGIAKAREDDYGRGRAQERCRIKTALDKFASEL